LNGVDAVATRGNGNVWGRGDELVPLSWTTQWFSFNIITIFSELNNNQSLIL